MTLGLRLELVTARAADVRGLREHDALLKEVEYLEGLDLAGEKECEDEIMKLEARLSGIEVC